MADDERKVSETSLRATNALGAKAPVEMTEGRMAAAGVNSEWNRIVLNDSRNDENFREAS